MNKNDGEIGGISEQESTVAMNDGDIRYVGAAIFWLYIVAALVFTTFILHTLLRRSSERKAMELRRRRAITIFSLLAAVSFATLSANMLNVLIQSFQTWCRQHQTSLSRDNFFLAIWTWSLTSRLFRDFAEAIVASNARYLWTESSLLVTFAVTLNMAIEGVAFRIPHLWAYFCLGQILPVSFAQNLLYVALLRWPSKGSRESIPASSLSWACLHYCVCLGIAPFMAGGPALMRVILIARSLLFAPLLLTRFLSGREGRIDDGMAPYDQRRVPNVVLMCLGMCLVLRQAFLAVADEHSISQVVRALFAHPAVSALGYDLIISVVSSAVWTSVQRRHEEIQQSSEKTL